ncbi:MAG: tripartite tricarboxylate transporter TctB family protein [Bacteroidota bacterium]
MNNSNLLTGLLALAVSGLAFLESRSFTFFGRVFLDWTIIALTILGLALAGKGLLLREQVKSPAVKEIRKVWLTVLGLFIYLTLIPVFGFIIASVIGFTLSGVLLSPCTRRKQFSTWWRALGVGLLVTFIFYALFKLALAVPLPGGVLGIG